MRWRSVWLERKSALRRLAALGLVFGVLAVASAVATSDDDDDDDEDGKGPRRDLYVAIYPAGPGRDLAARACLVCHSASLVTQQAKDSTAWEKTMGQMEKWGVKLTPAEHDTLRGYLVTHFGPRATRSPARK